MGVPKFFRFIAQRYPCVMQSLSVSEVRFLVYSYRQRHSSVMLKFYGYVTAALLVSSKASVT